MSRAIPEQGSASGLPTLPPIRRGRITRASSLYAAGDCSLVLLRRDGEPIPANVARVRDYSFCPTPPPNAEQAFLLALISTLPFGQVVDVRNRLEKWKDAGSPTAELAYNLLVSRMDL